MSATSRTRSPLAPARPSRLLAPSAPGVDQHPQVQNLTVLSRDVYALVSLIPGVQYERNGGSVAQPGNVYFVYANGGRNSANDVSLDGVSTHTYATPWASALQVSMASVAEVKVLSGTFQAEYGRASGANIQLVSKSGTKDFHGLGRHLSWLNHTQFTGFNSTASFHAKGNQTNTSFGQYTAAARPRICQASLRFQF